MSDNEWEQITASGATIKKKWQQVKQSDFKFQNETKDQLVAEEFYSIFHEIYNYHLFSNIDNL